ncbi:hypothetical protein Hanom_Chr10g00958571 [Helianthus anomalus]
MEISTIFQYITNKFVLHIFCLVGWHDIIQVEHISLGDDCLFNWSKTNSRLLVTKLQQAEVLE